MVNSQKTHKRRGRVTAPCINMHMNIRQCFIADVLQTYDPKEHGTQIGDLEKLVVRVLRETHRTPIPYVVSNLAAEVGHHLRKSAWTREWQLEHVEIDAWNCWHYRFRHKKSQKVVEASSREDEGGFDAAVDDLRLVPADVRKK